MGKKQGGEGEIQNVKLEEKKSTRKCMRAESSAQRD